MSYNYNLNNLVIFKGLTLDTHPITLFKQWDSYLREIKGCSTMMPELYREPFGDVNKFAASSFKSKDMTCVFAHHMQESKANSDDMGFFCQYALNAGSDLMFNALVQGKSKIYANFNNNKVYEDNKDIDYEDERKRLIKREIEKRFMERGREYGNYRFYREHPYYYPEYHEYSDSDSEYSD